jgi:hypothetical protein
MMPCCNIGEPKDSGKNRGMRYVKVMYTKMASPTTNCQGQAIKSSAMD